MATPKLQLDRKIDMYGHCDRINARVGGELFAIAIRDPIYTKTWGLTVHSPAVTDYVIPMGEDVDAAIEHVIAIINLSFRVCGVATAQVAA